MKKRYTAPSVRRFGTVAELTRESGLINSDDPIGTPNTAFCSQGSSDPACRLS